MAKRVSEEIDGLDVFTYDTDLLAAAQELRKPELLELAKGRRYKGLHRLNKLELAIIHADTLTTERDESRKLPEINAQMTETLDEIAPLPARTLREQHEGTAADLAASRAGVVRADETSRPEFAPGDRLTNPVSGHQFEVIEWTHAVILRNLTSGARSAVPAEMARLYRRAENEKAYAGAIKPTADEIAGLYEQAAAIDEKRTIARAFLSTPPGVMLTWDEIQRGYLDARAENEKVYAALKAREEAQRDEPRDIDMWLTHGMVLVGPNSGDRYRFVRWDGGTAVLSAPTGVPVRIDQADVTTWQYLPKASAEGVAAAKRRVPWRETFLMHERTGEVYRILGMDNIVTGQLIISHACGTKCSEHERAISLTTLRWDYIACDEHGNVQPLPRNSLNRRSAPAYAVGDCVRWSEDRRLMFVRSVTPTGAYVAPTMDGPLMAFAASEDLSPASKAARLQVFTAGELYAAPEMPKANVVLNLATLLDDPARRLPTRLVRTDGTHPEVFSFVFASDGAEQIFAETVHYLGGLIQRGPVVLLVLCHGGKHRSVAFGEAVARHFGAPVTHFHKDLVPYGKVSE